MKDKNIENIIDVWKTTVDVQKHFNELCLKARQLAITALSAFLGGLGYLGAGGGVQNINGFVYSLLTVLATIVWMAFHFNDRHGYHRLLKGAVSHGLKIENAYKADIPIDLTASIGEHSPVKIFGFNFDSNKKVTFFYSVGYFVIWIPYFSFLIYKAYYC